jgi:hypothetical protein
LCEWLALDFIAGHALTINHLKVMKPSVVLSALLIVFALGCKDKEKIIEVVDEKPDDIFKIELCPTLNQTVMSLFTESNNNREKYPQLFSESTQEQIVLTKESDVYVSYVTEGASVPSTLGYYVYNQSGEPGSPDGIDKKIALPNVSSSILEPGDSRWIGKYPAGTVVGFYLIIGGYSNSTVNFSKPTYYTNFTWNPGSYRQHVLFREKQCNNIVMAFEDKAVGTPNADDDFNDIIFLISDNDSNAATTSFSQETVQEL